MGLFDRIFGSRKERHDALKASQMFKLLNAYTPVWESWGGAIYESELVRAAIDAKARHVAKMSVEVHGAAKPVLQTRLRSGPNEFQTWSQFLYRVKTVYEINTTAFIVPVIDQYGDTTGVYCALPSQVEFVQNNGTVYLKYHFADGNTAAIELERCGILTKFQYKSDFTGDGNNALNQTMALIDIQNKGITEGVRSSATYRFMARYAEAVFDKDLEEERKRFTAANLSAEAEANGGLLLFPATYNDIRQIESKPFVVDAEQMKIIQQNVYNYFGVNEKIMQNIANADELDSFFSGDLEPFSIQLSEVLSRMFFTSRERASGSRVVVTANRLQYMSVMNKLRLIQTLGDRGMLTINEGRELLNYAAIDGGDELIPIRGEYYNALEGKTDES